MEVDEFTNNCDIQTRPNKHNLMMEKEKPKAVNESSRHKRFSPLHQSSVTEGSFSPATYPRCVKSPDITSNRRAGEYLETVAPKTNCQRTASMENRNQNYMVSSHTGLELFRMEFEATGYEPENITVHIRGDLLTVNAIQKENKDGKRTTNQMCRKIKLPADIEQRKLRCALVEDKIILEAPTLTRKQGHGVQLATERASLLAATSGPKNTPIIIDNESGKNLHIFVEVGRLFRADDIIVQVKGVDKILISANREEDNATTRLTARMSREFDLKQPIVPSSLQAGLTVDGVLRIVAAIFREFEGDLNGHKTNVKCYSIVNGNEIREA